MEINSYCYHLAGMERMAYEHELQLPFCPDRYSLILILSGKGQIEIGRDSSSFCPRKLYWCGPGEEIAIRPALRQSVCLYRILFDIIRLPIDKAGKAEKDEPPVLAWGNRELTISDPGKSIRVAHDMHKILCKEALEAERSFFKAQSLFYELLDMIAISCSDESISSARMEDVVAYVRAHYADVLPRNRLASMAGVHPDHFSRLFRKTTGKGYVDFVTEIRISRAKERLLSTKEGLLEIARKVGYKDEFYFSRKFKQIVGTAPTVYLRKPKSIFSLACNYTAGLLVVGHVPPIGSVTPWIGQRYGNVLRSGPFKPIYWDTCDIRRLKEEARPDVIVCHDKQYDAEQLEMLREIAPTLSIPIKGMDWREQFMTVSELVCEAAKARHWLERYDAWIDATQQRLTRHIDPRATVLIVEVWADELMVFGDSYGRAGHIVYQSFGMSPPKSVKESVMAGAGYQYIGKEQLAEYDADYLFLIVHEDPASRRTADLLQKSEQWRTLKAVRDGRAYEFDGGMFYGYDPASTEAQLQQIENRLSDSSK